jgi:hypothetical protein
VTGQPLPAVWRAGALLRELAVHPGPASFTIFLLQLKVVWGMWRVRDLTTGNTSSYFVSAHAWHAQGITHPLWSPLYLAYYGSFLGWTADAYRRPSPTAWCWSSGSRSWSWP